MTDLRDAMKRAVKRVYMDSPGGEYPGAGAYVDAILALPEMQARERVIEAVRAWSAEPYAGGVPTLLAAVAELDVLDPA